MKIRRALSLLVFFLSIPCFAAVNPQDTLASLPLTFEVNQGQAPARYGYLMRRDGMTVLFTSDGADIVLPGAGGSEHTLGLIFTHARPDLKLLPENRLKGQSNYLLGADPSNWIEHVPNYGNLLYPNLYPGISLDFYANSDSLEHDFRIAAGADPSLIGIRVAGAHKVSLSAAGDLEIHAGASTLILKKPVAYQLQAGRRHPVQVAFRLRKDGSIGFRLGAYDRKQPLVIDPVLTFSTYLSGEYSDKTAAVTTDASGDIYITGSANSPDFPTKNAEQSQLGCGTATSGITSACENAFITKLDPTGKSLIYSTYLGGTGQDQGAAIAVDSSGDAIVAGISLSSDFPLAGSGGSVACQNGGECYFLASLSPDGSTLRYSEFFGAEEANFASNNGRVAVDASGDAYLAGVTDSPSFETTPGTLPYSFSGYPDSAMFVLKVDKTGKLIYSTLVTGSNTYAPANLRPTGIAVDSSGQVTAAGSAGIGLPTTSGVVDEAFPNNVNTSGAAGFVLQLNASASVLNYATYVPGTDTVGAMAVDGSGNVYVTGGTSESNLPVSANAYQKTLLAGPNCSCNSGYVVKLNGQGTAILAATYLSGTPASSNQGTDFTGLALDGQSNVFLGGNTGSSDFPVRNPLMSDFGG